MSLAIYCTDYSFLFPIISNVSVPNSSASSNALLRVKSIKNVHLLLMQMETVNISLAEISKHTRWKGGFSCKRGAYSNFSGEGGGHIIFINFFLKCASR